MRSLGWWEVDALEGSFTFIAVFFFSLFFAFPLSPWYQDQEIQPAFNVGLNSVLPYIYSPFGPSY